ncbi:MAG: hypothetical protein IAG13_00185 [Deltaproteobacteria bacterium]|nr:hypothetical protein [Nannocystaceae bacterium]
MRRNLEQHRDTPADDRRLRHRGLVAIAVTLALYAATVATHLGEFWPFSIYPMFSLAGRPWSRAMLIDVTGAPEIGWHARTAEELPGPTISTRSVALSTNDLSKFVQLTADWSEIRVRTLRTLLAEPLSHGREIVLLRANGRLEPDGGVTVRFTPVVRLSADQTSINPQLGAGI